MNVIKNTAPAAESEEQKVKQLVHVSLAYARFFGSIKICLA